MRSPATNAAAAAATPGTIQRTVSSSIATAIGILLSTNTAAATAPSRQ